MAAKKKTQTKKEAANWRQTFVARFPQYADIIDGGPGEAEARRVFGNELVDLILDVAENSDQYDFTTQAGIDAFNAKVFASPWLKETIDANAPTASRLGFPPFCSASFWHTPFSSRPDVPAAAFNAPTSSRPLVPAKALAQCA